MKRLVFLALLAVHGCDKGTQSTPQSEPSGEAVSTGETAMLVHLPAGNVALFGGNLQRFQKFMSDSPLSRMMGTLMQSTAKGMTEWLNCYVKEKDQKMLAALKLEAGQIDMASVLTGVELSHLEACAKGAGFPTTMDADGKFLGIEFPNPQGPMKTGYLALPGGMLYTRMSMEFPAVAIHSIDRAALEQDVAAIAKTGNATNDKALVAQFPAVDRSKPMWFVGNAAGTPVADKVGTVHGVFDIGDGIAMDVTLQVVDKTLADQIADGVAKTKQEAASRGGTFKSVLDKLELTRKGDRMRFKIAVDNAQLSALADQFAQLAPGANAQP